MKCKEREGKESKGFEELSFTLSNPTTQKVTNYYQIFTYYFFTITSTIQHRSCSEVNGTESSLLLPLLQIQIQDLASMSTPPPSQSQVSLSLSLSFFVSVFLLKQLRMYCLNKPLQRMSYRVRGCWVHLGSRASARVSRSCSLLFTLSFTSSLPLSPTSRSFPPGIFLSIY